MLNIQVFRSEINTNLFYIHTYKINVMFQNLPLPIYGEIYEHSQTSDLPTLMRLNTRAKQTFTDRINENLSTICCKEPSIYEIANWLWNESQLLSYQNTVKHSFFKQPQVFLPNSSGSVRFYTAWDNIRFYFVPIPGRIEGELGLYYSSIVLYLKTGEIFGGRLYGEKKLSTKHDILNFLLDNKLRYTSYDNDMNWQMIRDIFFRRLSCSKYPNYSDACFIYFVATHLPPMDYGSSLEWYEMILFLTSFLKPLAQRKLIDEFKTQFDIDIPIPNLGESYDETYIFRKTIKYDSHFQRDPDELNNFFAWMFSTFKPEDLSQNDPRINYSNTTYD